MKSIGSATGGPSREHLFRIGRVRDVKETGGTKCSRLERTRSSERPSPREQAEEEGIQLAM